MMYLYMLLFFVWNVLMASFLTIPLYKLVCNLSYIDVDGLQAITYYSKEFCVYNNASVLYFLINSNYFNVFASIWYSSLFCPGVLHLNKWCAHESSEVNIFVAADGTNKSVCASESDCILNFSVKFFSRVSNVALIEFISLQDSILVSSGEPALVFFRIYNPTGLDLTGMSMYFVYPSSLSLYVSKVQCFCFDLLQIKKHESVELPVLFYLDSTIELETLILDSTIYLSYVFFIQ